MRSHTFSAALRHLRPAWNTAVISLAVLAAVGCAAGDYAQITASDSTPIPVGAVHVDVIGDSLSTGFRTPGDTWPDRAQSLFAQKGLKADITNASENGAGYVAPGEAGNVFLDEVNRIVNFQSQVVVLFGSDNDTSESGLDSAVKAALARVKVLAPEAKVFVVGPTSEADDAGGELVGVLKTLKEQAAAVGAQFVDPVSLGWFQGDASSYLSDDLEHPNAAGEAYLAQRMTDVLAPAIKHAMRQDQIKPTPTAHRSLVPQSGAAAWLSWQRAGLDG